MELKELNYLICSILFDLTMIFIKTIFFRENLILWLSFLQLYWTLAAIH